MGLSKEVDQIILVAIMTGIIALIAAVSYFIAKRVILRLVESFIEKSEIYWLKHAKKHRFFHLIAHTVPGLFIYISIPLISVANYKPALALEIGIGRITLAYIVIMCALATSALLNATEERCRKLDFARIHPVKTYAQVLKIILFIFSTIIVVSVLIDKSPAYLLTGLGALTAVIMLVFKDSILGFVASIQLSLNDMIRIGDWIEVPNYGANGDVVDMSLNTIKVQNFDKTIVTVPSYSLLNTGVINWRGMKESGGRRIKRNISIDMKTIKFCDESLLDRLKKMSILKEHIEKALHETHTPLSHDPGREQMTNIGLFRAYVKAFLKAHPKVHPHYTFLVRQLQPIAAGLPLEIYIFVNDTNWTSYEEIQSDIFEHLYAVIPLFDLRIFQYASGEDAGMNVQTIHLSHSDKDALSTFR